MVPAPLLDEPVRFINSSVSVLTNFFPHECSWKNIIDKFERLTLETSLLCLRFFRLPVLRTRKRLLILSQAWTALPSGTDY